MAGGPIFPRSAFPATSSYTYPLLYSGDGGVSPEEETLGVTDATTLDADSTWRLRFQMPPTLPTGTAKLKLLSLADAVTGVLKVNWKWKSVSAGEDPSTGALNAEGTTTITWSTNDDDEYQQTLITMDADTVVGGEEIVGDLVFEDTGMTLAVESGHIVSMIWE